MELLTENEKRKVRPRYVSNSLLTAWAIYSETMTSERTKPSVLPQSEIEITAVLARKTTTTRYRYNENRPSSLRIASLGDHQRQLAMAEKAAARLMHPSTYEPIHIQ